MSALQQAQRYWDLGLAVVPVPLQSKQCQLEDWNAARLPREALQKHYIHFVDYQRKPYNEENQRPGTWRQQVQRTP